MNGTDIADQDGLLLDRVAALAVGGAGVDGVLEVDAFADGVALDELVAHFGTRNGAWKREEKTRSSAMRIDV